jgi:hypothetical protein
MVRPAHAHWYDDMICRIGSGDWLTTGLCRMANEVAALVERIDAVPGRKKFAPGQKAQRHMNDTDHGRDLVARAETLPPAVTAQERQDRRERFVRSVTHAVRRGALPERFATVLLRKMLPVPRAEPVQLPELPAITDAASYKAAQAVVAQAVADGRITAREARDLVYVLKAGWDAVRAARREQR